MSLGLFEDWYVVEGWNLENLVQNKPNFSKIEKNNIFQLLCTFKGRTTPNLYAFCVKVIVAVEEQMNFAPFELGSCTKFCLLTSAKL